jgi:hypothetical protein
VWNYRVRKIDGAGLLVGYSVARQDDAAGRTTTSATFRNPVLDCPHGTTLRGRCIEG